jgi:hypothetical protein
VWARGRENAVLGKEVFSCAKKLTSKSGAFLARVVLALLLGSAAISLAFLSFAASSSPNRTALATTAVPPTFGHPVISSVAGEGFEQTTGSEEPVVGLTLTV